jgi:hypothetical protein
VKIRGRKNTYRVSRLNINIAKLLMDFFENDVRVFEMWILKCI